MTTPASPAATVAAVGVGCPTFTRAPHAPHCGGDMVWDSPGGYGLEQFLPPCVCGHPVVSHKYYDKGVPRRKCQVGTPDLCPCKAYTAGDPANWPPQHIGMTQTQMELPDE